MTPTINWARLARAVEYYQQCGYYYLEVPWVVGRAATAATLPNDARPTALADMRGDLVGSAEQSFIELMLSGALSDGLYVALTPCFRQEPVYNDRYQPYFMKVELIHVGARPDEVEELLEAPLRFMNAEAWSLERMRAPVVPVTLMDGSIDLELNGIEIGSYGWRGYRNFQWVYGTGLAEPRFSVALR